MIKAVIGDVRDARGNLCSASPRDGQSSVMSAVALIDKYCVTTSELAGGGPGDAVSIDLADVFSTFYNHHQ